MSNEKRVVGRSEREFELAFVRLKSGKPKNIAKGSAVTQNNVAREAGKDPSALKKTRFPELIEEIQKYTASSVAVMPSTSALLDAARRRNRELVAENEELRGRFSELMSKVLSLQVELLGQWRELEAFRAAAASNVVSINKAKGKR